MITMCLFSLKYDAETLSESEGDDDIVEVDDIEDDEYEVIKK